MRLTFCNWCSDLPAGHVSPLRDELRSGTDADEMVVMLCHISEVLQFVVLVVGTSLGTELCALIEQHAPVATQPACVTDDSEATTWNYRWMTESSQSEGHMTTDVL